VSLLVLLLVLLACVRPVPAPPAPQLDPVSALATAMAVINPLIPYATAAMWLSPYPCKGDYFLFFYIFASDCSLFHIYSLPFEKYHVNQKQCYNFKGPL